MRYPYVRWPTYLQVLYETSRDGPFLRRTLYVTRSLSRMMDVNTPEVPVVVFECVG